MKCLVERCQATPLGKGQSLPYLLPTMPCACPPRLPGLRILTASQTILQTVCEERQRGEAEGMPHSPPALGGPDRG